MRTDTIYRRFGKRTLDIILGLSAFTLTLPLQAVIATVVLARLGWPVIFRQERAGLHGQPFVMYKFRTMRDVTTEDGTPLADHLRADPLGDQLRSWSLDELPEFWNVIKGDMSLVGPRPLPTQYLALYSEKQAARHRVRPGITGLAQVRGRNDLAWERRFRLDLQYLRRVSFGLDAKILMETLLVILQRRGSAPASTGTSPTFSGEPDVSDSTR
jgi:undecaprenyl phosphate N,N'-diacetylbacillosamine 1-phosphate transferase